MSTVSILGKGGGWEAAPHTAPRWGINDLVTKCDLDAVFNFHDLDRADTREFYEESIRSINEGSTRLVGLKAYADIPSSEAYPLQAVMRRFDTDYFANGICYMIAYALYTGKTQIDLYGVNMTSSHEYLTAERPCVEYWIGRAEGMGVKCTVHGLHSDLLQTSNSQLYGYGYFQMSTLRTEEDENGLQRIQRCR